MSSIDEIVRQRAEAAASGDEAVIATDVTGRIVYWDEAAEQLYGWTSEEALGRNVVDVTPTLMSQPEAAQIMKVLRSAESWTGTFEVRDKAGRTFPVQVTDSPVLNEDGKLIGIIGVSRRA